MAVSMNSVTNVESVQPRARWRFSLRALFWFQLLLLPAFLSPFYSNIHELHPYVSLIAVLVAPVCYVGLLVLLAHPRACATHRRPVLTSVRSGALFGIVFCAFAIGPLAARFFFERLTLLHGQYAGFANLETMLLQFAGSLALEIVAVAAFLLFNFAVLGAAVGGIIGLGRDLLSSRHANPQP